MDTSRTEQQPARVLVVDDEQKIRRSLSRALQLSGFEVSTASSGDEALARLAADSYDVMVLDLYMPGTDGEEVMRRVHEHLPEMLIIVLTGHPSLESAITAVKSAAVDYVLKPASVHEVVASVTRALQVNAEQRRRSQLVHTITQALDALRESEREPSAPVASRVFPNGTLHVHPLTLHRQHRLLTVQTDEGTHEVELSESEALALGSLMAHAGQVLSCYELACHAWRQEMDSTSAQGIVRPIIARLRAKLEPWFPGGSIIRNVRGRGYFLDVGGDGPEPST